MNDHEKKRPPSLSERVVPWVRVLWYVGVAVVLFLGGISLLWGLTSEPNDPGNLGAVGFVVPLFCLGLPWSGLLLWWAPAFVPGWLIMPLVVATAALNLLLLHWLLRGWEQRVTPAKR